MRSTGDTGGGGRQKLGKYSEFMYESPKIKNVKLLESASFWYKFKSWERSKGTATMNTGVLVGDGLNAHFLERQRGPHIPT